MGTFSTPSGGPFDSREGKGLWELHPQALHGGLELHQHVQPACKHCYQDAGSSATPHKITLQEKLDLRDRLVKMGVKKPVLSGRALFY